MLLDLDILDNSLKIGSDESFLYLPLSREPVPAEQKCLPEETELIDFDFELQQKKPVPEDLLGFSPSYEVIGDIALLEDPDLDKEESFKNCRRPPQDSIEHKNRAQTPYPCNWGIQGQGI